jgi:hypothetical protein
MVMAYTKVPLRDWNATVSTVAKLDAFVAALRVGALQLVAVLDS